MTEQNLGGSFLWYGEVVDVKDPDQSGRVRVRIYGRQDDKTNIKDEDLHWAMPIQDITSAALGKVGTSPLGLLKGSKVQGYWADSDRQLPIIQGSFGKAGDPKEGSSTDGAEDIDTDTGSIPTAATNQSPPVAKNPYSKLFEGRVTINDINNGVKSIHSISKDVGIINNKEVDKKLKEPTIPTTAHVEKGNTGEVLDLVKKVDPNNLSASLPKMVDNFKDVRNVMNITSPKGLTGMMGGGIEGAIGNLAQQLGAQNVIGPLMSVLGAGTLSPVLQNALRQALGSAMKQSVQNGGRIPPSNKVSTVIPKIDPTAARPPKIVTLNNVSNHHVQQYYDLKSEPYPGYIEWKDPTTGDKVYTARGTEPHYSSPDDHIIGNTTASLTTSMGAALRSIPANNSNSLAPKLPPAATAAITAALTSAFGKAEAQGIASVLGKGFSPQNIIGMATKLIPGIAGKIQGMMGGHLPTSVLDPGKVGKTMQDFTKNQALLAKKKDSMKTALNPGKGDQDKNILDYAKQQAAQVGKTVTVPTSDGTTTVTVAPPKVSVSIGP